MLLSHLFTARPAIPLLLEARVDFLRGKFLPLLATAITKQAIKIPQPLADLQGATAEETAQKVFDYILTCDPDPQKKSVQWLLTRLMKGDFLLEDGTKAFDNLKTFARVKMQLPANERDINRVKTVGDLYALVEPFKEKPSQRQISRNVDQQMHEQAKVLLDTTEYKVLIPLTQAASCYFGINTEWCTAATNSRNYFDHYTKQGPLYIILDKKANQRWQFQPASNSYMNDADQPIYLPQFLQEHPPIAQLFIQLDGPVIATVRGYQAELSVYSDGNGGYLLKAAPGLGSKILLTIMVRDGMLSGISDARGSPNGRTTIVSQPAMADLLNRLKIEGNQTDMATESTYMLYYRDMFWGTLYEHAKPFLQLENGWYWAELFSEHEDVGGHTEFVLTSPEPLKYPNSDASTGANRAFAVAVYYDAGDEFSVNEVLGSSRWNKTKKNIMPTLSPAILQLLLHEAELKKWLSDSVIESSDLMKEDAQVLLDRRPELCNTGAVYKVQGLTPLVKDKIEEELSEADVDVEGDWFGEDLVVNKWDSIEDCVNAIGDEHAKWLAKLSNGEEHIEVDYHRASKNDIETLLNKLSKERQQELSAWLIANYADEIEEYKEDEDEDFDPTDMDDVAAFIDKKEIDEIKDVANNAMTSGFEVGAENEAMKNFQGAIREAPIVFLNADGYWGHDFKYDQPVGLIVSASKIVELIDAKELGDVAYSGWADYLELKVEANQPHYGYGDYDDEAAIERFEEELPELKVTSV